MATASSLMTTEELLAIPEDGTDRWLIAGELRERPTTRRNRFHSRTMARVTRFLDSWLDEQPEPRGQVLVGDAGVILGHDPDTTVDAYLARCALKTGKLFEAACELGGGSGEFGLALGIAFQIASDTIEDINEKIDAYLAARVSIIWIIDPHRRTITVHQPECEPELFNIRDELSAEPHLPGFRVPVARLFE